jgi:hypothetical protein
MDRHKLTSRQIYSTSMPNKASNPYIPDRQCRRKHEITFICRQFDDLEMAEISELDHFFLISVGTLVLLLQSGYAFLEAGAVRSKNAVNICLRYATHLAIVQSGNNT